MKTEKTKIQMSFECHQDWNAMKLTSCGRFCDVCKKEVIDFTGRSKEEFKSAFAENDQLCGRFKPEQIDLSLIRPVSLSFHRRAFLFISTLFITALSKPANAKAAERTEFAVFPSVNFSAPADLNKTDTGLTTTISSSAKPDKPFITTKKRKYYWSKRFPFIRSVKQCAVRMGNVRYL